MINLYKYKKIFIKINFYKNNKIFIKIKEKINLILKIRKKFFI